MTRDELKNKMDELLKTNRDSPSMVVAEIETLLYQDRKRTHERRKVIYQGRCLTA